MRQKKNSLLGFWALFCLVVGAQMGSGLFTLPTALAHFGRVAHLATTLSILGALLLAYTFGNLAKSYPYAGAPHLYVFQAFGKQLAVLTAWSYWMISWLSTTVVIITAASYLGPLLGCNSKIEQLFLQLMLLFFFTWVNIQGAKRSMKIEILLTLCKIIPLVLFLLQAFKKNLYKVSLATHLHPSFSFSDIQDLSKATLLAFWGFIGLETAITPSDHTNNPKKYIPLAMVSGTFFVGMIYYLFSDLVLAHIPHATLQQTTTPLLAITDIFFETKIYLWVSLVATLVSLGSLNAWILVSGQVAYKAASTHFLPTYLAQKNKKDIPARAIILSSIGIVPFLMLTAKASLTSQIITCIDISVVIFLCIYFLASLSYIKILSQLKTREKGLIFPIIGAFMALFFTIWMIVMASSWSSFIAILVIFGSGIPIIFYLKKEKNKTLLPNK